MHALVILASLLSVGIDHGTASSVKSPCRYDYEVDRKLYSSASLLVLDFSFMSGMRIT
jgi:hypothetical protein